MERAIDRAFAPRRLAAVALAVNSPGGSPVQSALIARRIRARADERGVPVLAFAEDVAASGGYWLACAGDEIYADENSIVGSIGVIAAGFGFVEAIARHGVERRVHTAGARKGMLDPFRPEDPGEVERLLAVQRDMHESFIAHVRARRGRRLKGADEELFSGEFWSGRQAIALGLVDGLGDLRGVLRDRFGERVRIRPVAARRGLRRRLGIGPAGGGIDAGALGAELWRRSTNGRCGSATGCDPARPRLDCPPRRAPNGAMFGFSLSKLVVLAALIAAVWYGLRWVQRRQQMQGDAERDRVEDGQASSSQDLVACTRCGVFVSAEAKPSCDRADCPL